VIDVINLKKSYGDLEVSEAEKAPFCVASTAWKTPQADPLYLKVWILQI